MNHTIILLDKYKKLCSLASDNAAAIQLGVSRQAISKWRHGENHPEADTIERMCIATSEPVSKWLPLIEAQRARTPAARQVWLRLAQSAAAAVALTAGLVQMDVYTSNASTHFAADNPGNLYIMSNIGDISVEAAVRLFGKFQEYPCAVSFLL